MTNYGGEPEPRIARLERSDELDRTGTERVLDLMDRRVANWQERHDSMQREHASMRRELDEFRDELRSIREERRRRDDWNR